MDERTLREPAQRVSPRARTMWQVSSLVGALVLLAALVVAGPVLAWIPAPWWALVLAVLVLAAYVAVVPTWRYAVHRWEVTDTAVYTQTGWWWIERRIAPMSRIQTVDFAQGPVERMFRLATLTATTASAAGPLRIAGLDRTDAERLARELTIQADTVPGDAT